VLRSSKLAGEEQFLLEHWKKMQSLEIACGHPAPAEMNLLLISCLRLDNNWLTVYPGMSLTYFSPSHTVISCVNLRCTCCTVVLRYDGREIPRPYQNAAPPIKQVINHIISAAPRHSGPSPLSFTLPTYEYRSCNGAYRHKRRWPPNRFVIRCGRCNLY
jgi:hypothetical protein